MQRSKKFVLFEPKFLEQLQADREYKQIQKPADALAKTSLSLDIGRILRDDTTPEDTKVKLYQDALRRYTNVRSTIPQEVEVRSNPLGPIAPPSPPPAEPQQRRRRRQQSPQPEPRPRAVRSRAKTKRLGTWVEY